MNYRQILGWSKHRPSEGTLNFYSSNLEMQARIKTSCPECVHLLSKDRDSAFPMHVPSPRGTCCRLQTPAEQLLE